MNVIGFVIDVTNGDSCVACDFDAEPKLSALSATLTLNKFGFATFGSTPRRM